ncbi:amidohydrolase family protein [soil metagenome]
MTQETILEPGLPIVDPHHHLWDRPIPPGTPPATHGFEIVIRRNARYLLDEFLADLSTGHNIVATVFLQCGAFHRADGPEAMKPVGETEFVNGVAAMAASRVYGPIKVCHGIVGHADLTQGSAIAEVLHAHIAAGNGRFRGIRHSCAWDADFDVLGPLARRAQPGLYSRPEFREGFAELSKAGLTFDTWLLEPQLPELIDLVRAFPDQPVVLDHVGTPLGDGSYKGRREERFPIWLANIQELAKSPKVFVKLGGLAMSNCNFPSFLSDPPAPSTQLADEWRPYIEACIEAFGAERCMFESNFPVDSGACTYDRLWNAFKIIAAGCSADEKAALFKDTAASFYRLEV